MGYLQRVGGRNGRGRDLFRLNRRFALLRWPGVISYWRNSETPNQRNSPNTGFIAVNSFMKERITIPEMNEKVNGMGGREVKVVNRRVTALVKWLSGLRPLQLNQSQLCWLINQFNLPSTNKNPLRRPDGDVSQRGGGVTTVPSGPHRGFKVPKDNQKRRYASIGPPLAPPW